MVFATTVDEFEYLRTGLDQHLTRIGLQHVVAHFHAEWYSCKKEWAFCYYTDADRRMVFNTKVNNHIGASYFLQPTKGR